ncbi:phosphonate ABC transporter ATP-binding protein [Microbacter sp. GSS18]|nr:phosphonate ABC transporter ATP-binding protein [Microbacter sp. GSS18]
MTLIVSESDPMVAEAIHPIEMRGVRMAFGEHVVLEDIDIRARAGEFIALVGPSGAGKSTLLRLLNGSHRAVAGQVSVLGLDLGRCSPSELRRLRTRVGFVFQQFGLVGRLSALENVLMGSLGSLRMPRYGVATYPRRLRERALDNLERVGLIDQRFQRADTLSGGQQQRVAIARALMQDAEVVLADEPVASLDPRASLSVLSTLKRLSDEEGFTVICSLHQVDYAMQVADRVVAVRSGAICLDRPTTQTTEEQIRAIYDDPPEA